MKRINGRVGKIVYLAIILLVFLVLTNPSILFFLPQETKDVLYEAWSSVFGDVSQIAAAIKINWVSIFQIVVIILFMMLLTNVVKLITERVKPKTRKGNSILSMINSYVLYAAVLVGVVLCLRAIGINLSTIFASIGILALIIGFAAESLIADVITGIFLVFEDDFNVGDVIEYSGFRGTVKSIGVRVTCIQDAGGNIKIVNNSDLRDILNRSKVKSAAICDVPIPYEADLLKAEKTLKEIFSHLPEKYPEIFLNQPQYLGVQELASSSVNMRFCAEVEEANIFKAQRMMNREAKLGMDQAGIEIPFQQIVVHNG